MRSQEKAKDLKGTWIRILRYAKQYWVALALALIAAMVSSILTQFGPNKLSEMTNVITAGIMTGIDMNEVARIGMTLIAFYAVSACLNGLQSWTMSTVTQRISQLLRTDISNKINVLPMGYFHGTTTGDILSRVTNDVDTTASSLSQSIATLVSAVTTLIACVILMIKQSGRLTLTTILSTIIGFALSSLIMGKSRKYFSAQQAALGAINGNIEENYSGHLIVKAYNGEKDAIRTFDKMNAELRSAAFHAQSLAGMMMPIMGFIGNFGYVAVCVVGAMLAVRGEISFGVIIAFMMYVRHFTQPLNQIAQAMQNMQSGAAAGERVFEFLDEKPMEDESSKSVSDHETKGHVVFEHVKFGYDKDRTIIHDFSCEAMPGQKIAIVGPTGAGKTTLVNLLMRFYEIDGGHIYIDGVDTKEMTREQVHEQFCMVLQDTWLFEGTIRENLSFNSENVTKQDLDRACRAVGLYHFIRTLPEGYDTVLTDHLSLSQGQKQQLTIARAMIANRPMLILDEATSSVDTRTEIQIQKAMDQLMKGRTSFVIAHRLSTIKNADKILVLRDGDVVETGTHEELLAKNGFYADLYNSQFEQ